WTHSTGLMKPNSYMGRLAGSGLVAPEDLIVEDAKLAVQVVVDYLRYGSPNWNPAESSIEGS
ncbi:unnamed protein product, partial [marine sediment metagenome]